MNILQILSGFWNWEVEIKKHYHLLVFYQQTKDGYKIVPIFSGTRRKQVDMKQIMEARRDLSLDDDATLLNCCYIGKMTEGEIQYE